MSTSKKRPAPDELQALMSKKAKKAEEGLQSKSKFRKFETLKATDLMDISSDMSQKQYRNNEARSLTFYVFDRKYAHFQSRLISLYVAKVPELQQWWESSEGAFEKQTRLSADMLATVVHTMGKIRETVAETDTRKEAARLEAHMLNVLISLCAKNQGIGQAKPSDYFANIEQRVSAILKILEATNSASSSSSTAPQTPTRRQDRPPPFDIHGRANGKTPPRETWEELALMLSPEHLRRPPWITEAYRKQREEPGTPPRVERFRLFAEDKAAAERRAADKAAAEPTAANKAAAKKAAAEKEIAEKGAAETEAAYREATGKSKGS